MHEGGGEEDQQDGTGRSERGSLNLEFLELAVLNGGELRSIEEINKVRSLLTKGGRGKERKIDGENAP
jgi:hypothetical protein